MHKFPGTICTDIKMSTIQKIGISHTIITRRPNKKEIEVSKCYNEMKVKTKTTKTNPSHIFGKYVAKLDNKSQMPSENIVKRTLQNRRTKNNHLNSGEIVGKYSIKIKN